MQKLVALVRRYVAQDAAITFALEEPVWARVVAQGVRPQAHGLHHAANRACSHQLAGFFGGAVLKPFRKAHRENAPGLGLNLLDGGQLIQGDDTRFVDHDVLAVAHDLNGGGGAHIGNGGADHHLDAGVFQNDALVCHAAGLWIGLGVGRSQVVFFGMHIDQLGARIQQGLGLAVNMVVVEPDGCEPDVGVGGVGHRFIPEWATPSMMRR